MAYLLDTNILIRLVSNYPKDIFKGLYMQLNQLHTNGKLYSIDSVKEEFKPLDAEYAEWINGFGTNFYLSSNAQNILDKIRDVANFINSRNEYGSRGVFDFFKGADQFLVAHAMANGHVIVTDEVVAKKPSQVKIPDICQHFGVECINFFDFLRAIGVGY